MSNTAHAQSDDLLTVNDIHSQLHTVHTPEGIEQSAGAFRRLIDMAVRRNGTYYLTYHRFARRDQVLACYPNFEEFLKLKRKYDPTELFQSDWYRHYRTMFETTA